MPAYDSAHFEPPAPVASVTLRDPSSRKIVPGVMLLVDSGADVPLLPESAVRELDLVNGANQDFELMVFDGRRTMARAPAASRCPGANHARYAPLVSATVR